MAPRRGREEGGLVGWRRRLRFSTYPSVGSADSRVGLVDLDSPYRHAPPVSPHPLVCHPTLGAVGPHPRRPVPPGPGRALARGARRGPRPRPPAPGPTDGRGVPPDRSLGFHFRRWSPRPHRGDASRRGSVGPGSPLGSARSRGPRRDYFGRCGRPRLVRTSGSRGRAFGGSLSRRGHRRPGAGGDVSDRGAGSSGPGPSAPRWLASGRDAPPQRRIPRRPARFSVQRSA